MPEPPRDAAGRGRAGESGAMRQRPYRALRHRDFRLLASATLISVVGTQMQNVGIDWHMYLLTRSPLALGT
ncbi:MAG TPA: hypothetical protein VE998_04900, partial [Terriglobales bacterium]|nr:hypothetical protein [Terriglobales bacterium]